MERSNEPKKKDTYMWLRWLITAMAIIVALIRLLFPKLEIDAVSLGLIILALVPWLSPIIRTIEIAGIGKIELQEIKDQVDEIKGAVESANQKAEYAAAPVSRSQRARKYLSSGDSLRKLSNKYVKVRKEFWSQGHNEQRPIDGNFQGHG